MGNRKDTYTVEEYKNKILAIGDLQQQKKAIDEKIDAYNVYIKGFESYHRSIANRGYEKRPTPNTDITIPALTPKKSRAAKVLELLKEVDRPLVLKEIIYTIMQREGQDVNDEDLFRTLEKGYSGMIKVEVDKNDIIKRRKNENNKWVYYLAPKET